MLDGCGDRNGADHSWLNRNQRLDLVRQRVRNFKPECARPD
jgi:hypothetical protein